MSATTVCAGAMPNSIACFYEVTKSLPPFSSMTT